ncbi:HAD family hydrolase [Sulfobacillus thermosulfidooxidans]|uniref:HAD family hydrolase n=1 Tax=Sulfobacillus thermosulfidooxidans TaxID=28034 RepID=UPI0006B44606|nr:HAD family hydrolase [Sulfobacillus thermosulfidooxidans]
MYTIDIPGQGELQLAHAVFDFNGTLANGGDLLPDLGPLLFRVSNLLPCVILTADSFGSAHNALKALPVRVEVVKTGKDKARFVEQLVGGVVAVGNGWNDYEMFTRADLSIVTGGPEGTAAKVLQVADIFVPNIYVALDLLLNPKKIIATLRI